jgi:ABC-type polysaccharide/polyol phosphate export permease
MFFSPVFWPVDLVGYQSWIIDLNPFAWMIETFRSPILTGSIQINLWIRLLMLTLLNLIVGVIALSRARTKIAYWA